VECKTKSGSKPCYVPNMVPLIDKDGKTTQRYYQVLSRWAYDQQSWGEFREDFTDKLAPPGIEKWLDSFETFVNNDTDKTSPVIWIQRVVQASRYVDALKLMERLGSRKEGFVALLENRQMTISRQIAAVVSGDDGTGSPKLWKDFTMVGGKTELGVGSYLAKACAQPGLLCGSQEKNSLYRLNSIVVGNSIVDAEADDLHKWIRSHGGITLRDDIPYWFSIEESESCTTTKGNCDGLGNGVAECLVYEQFPELSCRCGIRLNTEDYPDEDTSKIANC